MKFRPLVLGFLFPMGFACTAPVAKEDLTQPDQGQSQVAQTKREPIPMYSYEVVKTYPHATTSYTQGLIWIPAGFYESCGLYGQSHILKVNLADGKPIRRALVPSQYFAEGMALFDGKLYQITWKENKGFIYDAETFKKLKEFTYDGEGWGLTNNDKQLILSDGTNMIRFMNPETLKVERKIYVYRDNNPKLPYTELNELEYIDGEIWANVWGGDEILRINPENGKIVGIIDFSGLLGYVPADNDDVLNGIAYDAKDHRIFVTGKRWPKLFEVKVKKKG